MNKNILLPPEWYPQSGVMLTWPHENSDWADMLEEVESCFVNIAREISFCEKVLIVTPNKAELLPKLSECRQENLLFAELPSNDTWARDHGGITLLKFDRPVICDFCFNGWGLKFASNFDNQLTRKLFDLQLFRQEVSWQNELDFVLEGGSIESDGKGTLLTTSECLLSFNRNGKLTKNEIEEYLIEKFGLKRILWLNAGYLAGDDTDSHVDTLARFCSEDTIAYVQCTDKRDEHYRALQTMEQELKSFTRINGEPYRLIPLPMAEAVYHQGERIPATYANFLIINEAVLVPVYQSDRDELALSQIQKAFPDRHIIGINCLPLIKQHGSLHCVTMQFPAGVL